MPGQRETLSRRTRQRHQHHADNENHPDQHQRIAVRQDQRLALHHAGKELQRGPRRIAGQHRFEAPTLSFEELLHDRPCRVDILDQPVPVEMQAVVHHRADRCQTERTAKFAGQILATGGVS